MRRIKKIIRSTFVGRSVSFLLNLLRLTVFKPNLKTFYIKKDRIKKKILFASSVGMNPDFYLGSILAKAMNDLGHETLTLICDKSLYACFNCSLIDFSEKFLKDKINENKSKNICYICNKYGTKIVNDGKLNFVNYSNFFNSDRIEHEFQKINNIQNIDSLKKYTYNKINIGNHSFSATVRFFANPNIKIENNHLKVFQSYTKSGLITVEVLKNLSKKFDFTHIVLDHGIYIPQGIIVEYCKKLKKNITTYATEIRNKCFIFSKNQSYHYEIVKKIDLKNIQLTKKKISHTLNFLKQRRLGVNQWLLFNERIKTEKIKIDKKKINLAIFTNVLWDARVHFKEAVFETCEEWVLNTIKVISELSPNNINLYIRIHPGEEKGFVKSRYPLAPLIYDYIKKNNINFVKVIDSSDNFNSYDLANTCDYSICYASKIAIELAAIGKKVITTGDAWTRNKNITHDIKNKKEYKQVIKNINDKVYNYKFNKKNAIKFAYYYLFEAMKEIDFMVKRKGNPPYRIDDTKIFENNSLKKVLNFILN